MRIQRLVMTAARLVVAAAILSSCTVSDRGLPGEAAGSGGTSGAGGSTGEGGSVGGSGGSFVTDAGVLPCEGATGVGKAPGQSCRCAGECASGFCADGVCCEEACTGACRSCATAAAAGKCRFVGAGESDPHKVCKAEDATTCRTTGTCDGQGACVKHPAGTTCGTPGACETTRYRAAPTCDGAGTCKPSPYVECNPLTCSASACRTRCETSAHCAQGLTCNTATGMCEGLRQNGAACTATSQCASGHCSDGVCCAEACEGQCRSCALPDTRGQCRLVPAGQAGSRRECSAETGSPCGRSGFCNGQGSCALQAAGTQCAAPSCTNATERAASSCDGAGTCVAGATRTCPDFYACGGAATCLSSCSTDGACAGGAICVLNACGLHPILEVKATAVAPLADGIIDPVWSTVQAQAIAKPVLGTATNNFSASFRALWSSSALHLLIEVQDSRKQNDSEGQNSFDDDTVEVYLDADGSRGTTLDGMNDHHMLFGWGDTVPNNVSLRRIEGIGFGQSDRPAGYVIEISLPWTTLGTTAANNKVLGLDVHVNDDDNGGVRERKIAWFTTQDVSFRDPSSYGRIRLVP